MSPGATYFATEIEFRRCLKDNHETAPESRRFLDICVIDSAVREIRSLRSHQKATLYETL